MNRKNIVLIIPYFGKLPWYFPYFIHSCKFNSDIDFIILSDIKLVGLPPNVKYFNYSLEKFRVIASKALGFEVVIEHGYKLCDFKPAYGYIFSNLIEEYDFWGHCD